MMPTAMPNKPPVTLMATASMMNCNSTFRKVAPRALRMPISRVRSVTDTNMMFMIPMPPTSSDIAAMLPSSTVIVPVVSVIVAIKAVMFLTVKSFSTPAAR